MNFQRIQGRNLVWDMSITNWGRTTKPKKTTRMLFSYDSGAFEAYNNLGLLHIFKKEYASAETNFEAAVRANVNFAVAHLNLGIAQRGLNKYADAEKSYKRAISLQKTLAQAYYNLALLYDDYWDRPQQALPAWQDYLAEFDASIDNDVRNYVNGRITKLDERLEPRTT